MFFLSELIRNHFCFLVLVLTVKSLLNPITKQADGFHLQTLPGHQTTVLLLRSSAWLGVVWASSEQRLISSERNPSPSGRNVSAAPQQLQPLQFTDSALIFLIAHEGFFDL